MLKFRYQRITDTDQTEQVIEPTASIADTNPSLRIRNLLDDPALRRAMGLDLELAFARSARATRPINRRKLLEQAAA